MKHKSDWLAEVRFPADDGEYYLCTGVPISRRLVLTTAHDIPDAALEHPQLRFVYHVCHEKNYNWRNAAVVWNGMKEAEKIDGLLLQIDEVENLVSFIYTDRLPGNTTQWEGAGFPAAGLITEGELDGHQDAIPLNGEYNPWGKAKENKLALTNKIKLIEPGKWAGISGAPVMCQGRLIGIVESLNEDFKGSLIYGIPFSSLLNNQNFCSMIGFKDHQDQLEATKTVVKELLEESPGVVDALYKTSKNKGLNFKNKSTSTIVEALFTMDIEKFGMTINWAREIDIKPGLDTNDHKVLDKILNFILPCLFDLSMVTSAHEQITSGMMVRVPIATRTITEIFMAAADRRHTSFHNPVTRDELPIGKTCIEALPESGFSADADDIANEIETIFINKYVPEKFPKERLTKERLRNIVNNRLAGYAETASGQQRYYYICQKDDGPSMEAAAQILNSYFKQVIFIFLEGEAFDEEDKWIWPIEKFYKNDPGEADK